MLFTRHLQCDQVMRLHDAMDEGKEDIEHDQKFEMIAQYLDDLPEDQLNLLKMNFFEEKSHGEIAELTKIPLGTVKSRIRLALEKIRGKLEQDGTMANLNGSNESNMIN